MITQHMQLVSLDDARQWANDFDLDDDQAERLAQWIWAHAPSPNCTFAEHVAANFSFWTTDMFWRVADGRDGAA